MEYRNYKSYNKEGEQPSGVYIFRPEDETGWSEQWNDDCEISTYTGKVIQGIQCLGKTVDATLIMYPENQNYLSYDVYTNLKGLPDDAGHEVTINVQSNTIDNAEVFYTDSNAMAMET